MEAEGILIRKGNAIVDSPDGKRMIGTEDKPLEYTSHTKKRMQQRGIDDHIVRLILKHADSRKRGAAGAMRHLITKKQIKVLQRNGTLFATEAEAVKGKQIVVHEFDDRIEVLTVYHRTKHMKG